MVMQAFGPNLLIIIAANNVKITEHDISMAELAKLYFDISRIDDEEKA